MKRPGIADSLASAVGAVLLGPTTSWAHGPVTSAAPAVSISATSGFAATDGALLLAALAIGIAFGLRRPRRRFPSNIQLTLGLQDVLVLRNEDDRPQLIGGIEVGAGQSLSIPFYRVQDFQLSCSAHPSGQLRISVSAPPDRGPSRLWWRLARLRAWLRM